MSETSLMFTTQESIATKERITTVRKKTYCSPVDNAEKVYFSLNFELKLFHMLQISNCAVRFSGGGNNNDNNDTQRNNNCDLITTEACIIDAGIAEFIRCLLNRFRI